MPSTGKEMIFQSLVVITKAVYVRLLDGGTNLLVKQFPDFRQYRVLDHLSGEGIPENVHGLRENPPQNLWLL